MTDAQAPVAAPRSLPRWIPGPLGLFVAALGGVLFAVTLAKGVQDPDYFWHVRTGQLIVETGRLPTVDPFSFTWGGRPWTLHEWLSEVLMYGLVSAAGPALTLVLFGLLPVATFAVLAWMLARRGVGVLGFAVAAIPASLVVSPYLTLRPQAMSWLLLAVLLALLDRLRPERPRRALLLVPLFAVWANLHGLWVVGLGVVATYAIFTVLGRTPMASARPWMAVAALGAIAATALTPAGPEGVLYPLRYVDAGDWGLANIAEWQSPDFHEPAHLALLALIVVLGLNGGRATPGWLVMLSWVGVAMALVALRNAPIAAVLAVPAIALGVHDRWAARRAGGPPRQRPYRIQRARRAMEATLAAVVIGAALVITLPRSPGLAADPARFPVSGADVLAERLPDARVLAEYGWGGYVIHRLYPTGGRVFIDGRNDMYDQAILESYSAIRAAEDGWRDELDAWAVDAVLLPPSAPLVRALEQDEAWCEAYRDELQVLLLRGCPAA